VDEHLPQIRVSPLTDAEQLSQEKVLELASSMTNSKAMYWFYRKRDHAPFAERLLSK